MSLPKIGNAGVTEVWRSGEEQIMCLAFDVLRSGAEANLKRGLAGRWIYSGQHAQGKKWMNERVHRLRKEVD